MSDELKPCPFCGGDNEHRDDCYIQMLAEYVRRNQFLDKDDEKKLEEAWNTRQELTCNVKQAYLHDCGDLDNLMENIAFSPEDTVACICDSWGMDFRLDRGIRPNYCPNCGAKVVN